MTKDELIRQFFADLEETDPAWIEVLYERYAAQLYGNWADDYWEDGDWDHAIQHFGKFYHEAIKNGSADADIERQGWKE